MHRGYCWIDFETSTAADEAVQSMNLFDLAGQFLRVCKGVRYDTITRDTCTRGKRLLAWGKTKLRCFVPSGTDQQKSDNAEERK